MRRYELGNSQAGTYGEAVAKVIGAEPQRVFKTLIAQLSSGELVVAVVPVSSTLDLRAFAAAAGAKSAAMAPPQAAEKATGMSRAASVHSGSERRSAPSWIARLRPSQRSSSVRGGADSKWKWALQTWSACAVRLLWSCPSEQFAIVQKDDHEQPTVRSLGAWGRI